MVKLIYSYEDVFRDGVGPVRKLLMKNSKTMYLLAKAKAIEKGPRMFRRFGGYCLTEPELKKIFLMEGFNPRKKTYESYISLWKEFGLIKALTTDANGGTVFYILLDDTESSDIPLFKGLDMKFPESKETTDPGIVVA